MKALHHIEFGKASPLHNFRRPEGLIILLFFVWITTLNLKASSDAGCYIRPDSKSWVLGWEQNSTDSVSDYYSPLVGDLDGDGKPEIVCVYSNKSTGEGKLIVFSGTDLTQSTTINLGTYTDYTSGTPCGIVRLVNPSNSADTVGFIFLRTGAGYLRSYQYKGQNQLSLFKSFNIAVPAGTIGFADFDGNGSTEMYIGSLVFNAWNLTLIGSGSSNTGAAYWNNTLERTSIAADVLPGEAGTELVCGNSIYKVTSTAVTLLKTITPPTGITSDGQTLVADFDGDGLLDVLVKAKTSDYYIYAYNPRTGAILFTQTVDSRTNRYFNFPAIGDIDGDGLPEIICSSHLGMTAYKYNSGSSSSLQQLFTFTHTDVYGSAGVTLFDFNHDGKQELIYHDQDSLMVINGSLKSHLTGKDTTAYCLASVALTSTPQASYPVVADCDADGMADIAVAGKYSGESNTHLHLFSVFLPNYKKTARPVRTIWNQYAYNAVNIGERLTVPSSQKNAATYQSGSSSKYNAFLQQIKFTDDAEAKDTVSSGTPYPDLTFAATPTLSYTQGATTYTLTVQVTNSGTTTFYGPLNISVYNYNLYSTKKVTTQSFDVDIAAGATVSLTLTVPITTNYPRYTIVLNDRGQETSNYICKAESNFSNNTATLSQKIFEVAHSTEVLTPDLHICPGTIADLAVKQESGFSYKWYTSETDTNAFDNKTYGKEVPLTENMNDKVLPADSGATQLVTLFSDKDKTFWVETRRNDTLFTRVPVTLYYNTGNCLARNDTNLCKGLTVWKDDFGGNNDSDAFAELLPQKSWNGYLSWWVDGVRYSEWVKNHYYKNGAAYNQTNYDAVNSPRFFWEWGYDMGTNALSFRKKVGKGGGWSYLKEREVNYYCGWSEYGPNYEYTLWTGLPESWSDVPTNGGYGNDKTYGVYLNMDDHTWPDNPQKGYFLLQKVLGEVTLYHKKIAICSHRQYNLYVWATKIFDNPLSVQSYGSNNTNTGTTSLKLAARYADNSASDSLITDSLRSSDPVWKLYSMHFGTSVSNTDSLYIDIKNSCNSNNFISVLALDDVEVRYCGTAVPKITNPASACKGTPHSIFGEFVNDGYFISDTLSYQWQYSSDQQNWSIIKQGALGAFTTTSTFSDTLSFNPIKPTDQGYYRLVAGNPHTVNCSDCRMISDTVYLQVNRPDTVWRDTSICQGYAFRDSIITQNKTIIEHLSKTTTGCDSIVYWKVSMKPTVYNTVETTLCEGGSLTFGGGTTVSSAGTYVVTLQNQSTGCDSVVTYKVTLKAMPHTYTDTVLCKGKTLSINEKEINAAGTYNILFENAVTSCDSLVTYLVTEADNPNIHTTQSDIQQTEVTISGGKTPYLVTLDNTYLGSTEGTETLESVSFGSHELLVTDDNGCSTSTTFTQENTSILKPQPCFSPNGDGENDTWAIENIEYYPEATIQIFDRYGKLLRKFNGSDSAWDGTYQGRPMPSSDYWYIISGGGLEKAYTGHFSLKR